MRKVSLIFIFCLLIVSCEKDPDNLTILVNQSGTISLQVTDNNQSGFKGAKVSIYHAYQGGRIYYDSTDVKGLCRIGKVLQGQYEYIVVAEKNNIIYTKSEYFQVIAGEEKTIKTNPFSMVGDVSLRIVDYFSEPIENVNVALVPQNSFPYSDYYFQDLINASFGNGVTNTDGWVEFQDIPVNQYSILVYYDSNNYDFTHYNRLIYVDLDDNQSYTIQVDL